jgi:hypothetical protein
VNFEMVGTLLRLPITGTSDSDSDLYMADVVWLGETACKDIVASLAKASAMMANVLGGLFRRQLRRTIFQHDRAGECRFGLAPA